MGVTLFTNVLVFDGTGSDTFAAEVLVVDNRIQVIADHVSESQRREADTIIDGEGCVLMPGMTDGHAHLGFGSTLEHRSLTRQEPEPEKAMMLAHAGRVMLDHGFTSCYSGGNRLPHHEVAARKAWSEGWMPGPRYRAASWEGSAGMVEPGVYDFSGIDARESDVEGVVAFVESMADIGVDIIKMSLSGESAVVHGTSRILQFSEEEVAAASEAAQRRGVWLTGHAHASESIKQAVRNNYRMIYHCTFPDEEALDMLEANRDRLFVAPTPGIVHYHLKEDDKVDMDGMEVMDTYESLLKVVPELHRRGIRLLIGGDYGFSFNPVGLNARDLQLFVEWFGLTPAEALRSATMYGGQAMGMGEELGLVRHGYLADLLLVEGNPLEDVTILQKPEHLKVIMKNGELYKADHERTRRNALMTVI